MQKREIDGYSVIRPIFLGGMTDLYVAHAPQGDRVVLRFLKEIYAQNRSLRKRFLHGAEVLRHVQHPHIIRLLEIGKQGRVPYMVLEYVESKTLREMLVQRDPILQRNQLAVLRQLAETLYFIHHKGYMHLDFKPENMLYREDGHVMIIDFDLCMKRHRKPVRLNNYPGTPAYLAPEIMTTQRADERADIFSFGVVAYELLTFRKPFERDSLEEARIAQTNPDVPPNPIERYAPDTPPALKDIIFKSLAKDVDKRYPSMSLVLKTLDALS